MNSRLLGRGVVAFGLTIGALMLPGAALTASPEVRHGQFDIIGEETNTNICGDWGVFRFTGTGTFTVVDFGNGVLQVQVLERATYTLTFLDEPQETWDSRFVQAFTFHATPGGTTVQTFALNSFEGPIRIHETATLVVGPDGSVRVDDATFVVDECPSAWTIDLVLRSGGAQNSFWAPKDARLTTLDGGRRATNPLIVMTRRVPETQWSFTSRFRRR